MDSTPGISAAMVEHLRAKAALDPSTYNNCTLMLDGMAIKQHISYDGPRDAMVGFVDLGSGQTDEQAANDVLVMMVVGTGSLEGSRGVLLKPRADGNDPEPARPPGVVEARRCRPAGARPDDGWPQE